MIEFYLFGIKIQLSFLFFAVVTAAMLADRTGLAVTGLICCILHELGHIAAFVIIRAKPCELCFEAAGIKLVTPNRLLPLKSELFTLSAGCVVNFLLGGMFFCKFPTFALSNLTIGLFNLLPVYALDGGKMIYTALCMRIDPVRSRQLLTLISFVCLMPLILCGAILFLRTHSLTMLITSLYLTGLLLFKSND